MREIFQVIIILSCISIIYEAYKLKPRQESVSSSHSDLQVVCVPPSGGGRLNSTCSTPNNERGTCIPIRRCPTLLAILTQREALSHETVQFLRQSQCGVQGRNPLICCSLVSTTGPPNITTVANDHFSEITDHPNIGKINQQFCGMSIEGDRVTFGSKTTFFEFPWMARLQYRTSSGLTRFQCGGTLINKQYVLTAAHCLSNHTNLRLVKVRLGDHDYSTEEDCETEEDDDPICAPHYQDIEIASMIAHPRFGRGKNDIALLRLAHPADTSKENVQPICLPVEETDLTRNLVGLNMIVAGWGYTEKIQPSSKLLKALLQVVPNPQCNQVVPGMILEESQMCAGGGTFDSCEGDSGGPLKRYERVNSQSGMLQYGIVSIGKKKCGTIGAPAIYTRVSHFMKWILDTISP